MNENEYTQLIAGAHSQKPLFTEWVFVLTEMLNTARQRLIQMQKDFSLDEAVGAQLDAIGVRVGISRNLPVKISDVYFALDDVGGIGFDYGIWKGEFDPSDGMTRLGDDTYRAVIKAKILMNHWDGQNGSLPEFLGKIFESFGVDGKAIDLQDMQTMHVAINLTQATTPPIVWELVTRRIIDVIAAGVGLEITDNNPWFGFDFDTQSVKGFDQGHWFPFDKASPHEREVQLLH